MLSRLVALTALCLVLIPAQLTAEKPERRQFLVAVQGEMQGDGTLQLSILFGDVFKVGAKIYSEPSHKLLLVALDHSIDGSPQALSLMEEARGHGDTAVVMTNMAGGAPRIGGLHRPAEDDRITIWALTRDGGEHLVAAGQIGSESFSFTSEVVVEEAVSAVEAADLIGRKIEHCCNSPCGLKECMECEGPYFTCCHCNQIECGWVECT